jgi:hypothetical protein
MNRRPSALDYRRDARIAKHLGVTPTGLRVLAKMTTHPEGKWTGGLSSGNPGSAMPVLIRQGLVINPDDVPRHGTITDAGRYIVRRAREMGW